MAFGSPVPATLCRVTRAASATSDSARTMQAVNYAAFAVSLVAVVIAGIALVRTEHRATRAERRDERAEERDEERVAREVEAAAARRRGQPVVTAGGVQGGPTASVVAHSYTVANSGAASITALWLWMEDGEGKVVSTRGGGRLLIAPGEGVHVGVDLRQPLPEGELTLLVEWDDADGRHREPTGLHPAAHA